MQGNYQKFRGSKSTGLFTNNLTTFIYETLSTENIPLAALIFDVSRVYDTVNDNMS